MCIQITPQVPTHVLFDADPGENGTLYIEGNKTLISLNLSRKSDVVMSQFIVKAFHRFNH